MDKNGLIEQFVRDFGWSSEVFNDEFRGGLLRLLRDLEDLKDPNINVSLDAEFKDFERPKRAIEL
jgi:hypothetical protein